MERESSFEKKFRELVENFGGIALKIRSYEMGWPDRLVLLNNNIHYFVELKRPDGLSRGLHSTQRFIHKKLTLLGHDVRVIDSYKTLNDFIDEIRLLQ